ncbi:hypothetical protein GPK34_00435 [Secundilactobacillus kimchicus]|uniref:hypothetical protein n=1 Tax=Secundilactobacillus kimchicus TaxID=528209 RepID=UPI001C01B342|nr:hypothetical protein [Secundilactobacillus kimchicus]MBT9670504.1 hypothetical protein [Secundilactobacillus kimchicus]
MSKVKELKETLGQINEDIVEEDIKSKTPSEKLEGVPSFGVLTEGIVYRHQVKCLQKELLNAASNTAPTMASFIYREHLPLITSQVKEAILKWNLANQGNLHFSVGSEEMIDEIVARTHAMAHDFLKNRSAHAGLPFKVFYTQELEDEIVTLIFVRVLGKVAESLDKLDYVAIVDRNNLSIEILISEVVPETVSDKKEEKQ